MRWPPTVHAGAGHLAIGHGASESPINLYVVDRRGGDVDRWFQHIPQRRQGPSRFKALAKSVGRLIMLSTVILLVGVEALVLVAAVWPSGSSSRTA